MRAVRGGASDEVLLVSSVEVEVLSALARALERHEGLPTGIRRAFDPDRWRATRASRRAPLRGIRLLGLLFPLIVRLGDRRRPRVVVATTNPFWLPTMLAVRRVRPLVALVYDVYPDALQVRWRLPAGVVAVMRGIVGFGLRRADRVVVLGDRVGATLAARHRLDGNVTVIPTGADPDDFILTSVNDIPMRLSDDEVLLSYVGNSGSVHDGRTLGLALADLLDRRTDVRAIVATRGDRADELLSPLQDSPRAELLNGLDDPAFRATMARTDIALVTLDAGAGLASLPSKVHSALAAGCAVLAVAPHDSDLADLVIASGAGIVVPPGDVRAAAAALEQLVDDPVRRARHAAAARTAAEAATPAVLAARWAALLRPLLASADGSRPTHD